MKPATASLKLVGEHLKTYFADINKLADTYPQSVQVVDALLTLTLISEEQSLRANGVDIIDLIGQLTTEKVLNSAIGLALAKVTETAVNLLAIKINLEIMAAEKENRVLH